MRIGWAWIAILMGYLGLLGWLADVDELAAVCTLHWPSMKFATSVLSMLAGGSCLAAKTHKSIEWAIGLAMVMVVASVCGAFAVGAPLNPSDDSIKTIRPGMPIWATLAAFFSVGVMRLAVNDPKRRRIAEGLIGVGVVALIGYTLNTPVLYYYVPGISTGMAITTAIAVLALGLSIRRERHDLP